MAGNIIEELAGVLQPQKIPAKSKTVSAEVSHIDEEGIAWVRLAGSEQETPTASVSTEVKRGDIVNVEWRNRRLYIAGNSTTPAVGVVRVEAVEQAAQIANAAAISAVADAAAASEASESAKASSVTAYNAAAAARSIADAAMIKTGENTEEVRWLGISLESFREEIRFAVASLANSTQIFNGDPLEDYQHTEIPTLTGYPTVPEFYTYDVCSVFLYCSDQLICGTNHFADHVNEICLNTTYNDFYQFRYDSTEQVYGWEQMTAAEIEALSNSYSYISVENDCVIIKSSKNNQTAQLLIASDGITPSRIYCC